MLFSVLPEAFVYPFATLSWIGFVEALLYMTISIRTVVNDVRKEETAYGLLGITMVFYIVSVMVFIGGSVGFLTIFDKWATYIAMMFPGEDPSVVKIAFYVYLHLCICTGVVVGLLYVISHSISTVRLSGRIYLLAAIPMTNVIALAMLTSIVVKSASRDPLKCRL